VFIIYGLRMKAVVSGKYQTVAFIFFKSYNTVCLVIDGAARVPYEKAGVWWTLEHGRHELRYRGKAR
jgi:hypothetical protein